MFPKNPIFYYAPLHCVLLSTTMLSNPKSNDERTNQPGSQAGRQQAEYAQPHLTNQPSKQKFFCFFLSSITPL